MFAGLAALRPVAVCTLAQTMCRESVTQFLVLLVRRYGHKCDSPQRSLGEPGLARESPA